MYLLAVVLVAGLAVGRASGGRVTALSRLRPRSRWLALGALAAEVALSLTGRPSVLLTATAAGLAAAFLLLNHRLPGLPLVTLGLLANLVVVAANGAMPVSLYAAARAGAPVTALADGSDPNHVPAGPHTRLGLLADIVPVALPGARDVASPGDLLVAAGLAEFLVVGMRRRPASSARAAEEAPRAPSAPAQVGAQVRLFKLAEDTRHLGWRGPRR